MNGIKHWKDWIHPIATVMGAWGGFPKPPKVFLELTRFELFRWFLVFILAYQGGAEEDIRQALIITVMFYLVTKLLNLRDVVSDIDYNETAVVRYRQLPPATQQQQAARDASAEVQAAQAAAREAAAAAAEEARAAAEAEQAEQAREAATEAFFGGYYV
jgi:hypothetical protein